MIFKSNQQILVGALILFLMGCSPSSKNNSDNHEMVGEKTGEKFGKKHIQKNISDDSSVLNSKNGTKGLIDQELVRLSKKIQDDKDIESLLSFSDLLLGVESVDHAEWATSSNFKKHLRFLFSQFVKVSASSKRSEGLIAASLSLRFRNMLIENCKPGSTSGCSLLGTLKQDYELGTVLLIVAKDTKDLVSYYRILELSFEVESRGGQEGLNAAYASRADEYATYLKNHERWWELDRHKKLVERLASKRDSTASLVKLESNPWRMGDRSLKGDSLFSINRLYEDLQNNRDLTLKKLTQMLASEASEPGLFNSRIIEFKKENEMIWRRLNLKAVETNSFEFYIVDRVWTDRLAIAQAIQLVRLVNSDENKLLKLIMDYVKFEFAYTVRESHKQFAKAMGGHFDIHIFLPQTLTNATGIRTKIRKFANSIEHMHKLVANFDNQLNRKVDKNLYIEADKLLDAMPTSILIHCEYPHMMLASYFLVKYNISIKSYLIWLPDMPPDQIARAVFNGKYDKPWFSYASSGTESEMGASRSSSLNLTRYEIMKSFASGLDFGLFELFDIRVEDFLSMLFKSQYKEYYFETSHRGSQSTHGVRIMSERLYSVMNADVNFKTFQYMCKSFEERKPPSKSLDVFEIGSTPLDTDTVNELDKDMAESNSMNHMNPLGDNVMRNLGILQSGVWPALYRDKILLKVFENHLHLVETDKARVTEKMEYASAPVRELENDSEKLWSGLQSYFLLWSKCYPQYIAFNKNLYFSVFTETMNWAKGIYEIGRANGVNAALEKVKQATSFSGYQSKSTLLDDKLLIRPNDLLILVQNIITKKYPTISFTGFEGLNSDDITNDPENAFIVMRFSESKDDFVKKVLKGIFGLNSSDGQLLKSEVGATQWRMRYDFIFDSLSGPMNASVGLGTYFAMRTKDFGVKELVKLHQDFVSTLRLNDYEINLLGYLGKRAMGSTGSMIQDAYANSEIGIRDSVTKFLTNYTDSKANEVTGLIDGSVLMLEKRVLGKLDMNLNGGNDTGATYGEEFIMGHIAPDMLWAKKFATYRQSKKYDVFPTGEIVDQEFESYYLKKVQDWRALVDEVVQKDDGKATQVFRFEIGREFVGPILSIEARKKLDNYWRDFNSNTNSFYLRKMPDQ